MVPARAGPLRVGWLSTGRGPGSRALLAAVNDAISDGSVNATIDYVFCSRERGDAEGSDLFLEQVAAYGIPSVALSFRRYRTRRETNPNWREDYNRDLLRLLEERPVDLLVFAGLLLILDQAIVQAFPALNLHPAAPGGPVGAWQEVIWELIGNRAQETGVVTQLATVDLDDGPIVTFCRFPLTGPRFDPLWSVIATQSVHALRESDGESNPLFQAIREEGVAREAPLLVETLRLLSAGALAIQDGHVVDSTGSPAPGGVDLSDEIEAIVRQRQR